MSVVQRIEAEYTPLCLTYIKDDLELVIEFNGDHHRVIYIAIDDKHIGIVSRDDVELLGVFDRLKVPTRMSNTPPHVIFSGSTPKELVIGHSSAEMEAAGLLCSLLLMEIGVSKTLPKVSVERVLDKIPSLTHGPWTYRTSEIK